MTVSSVATGYDGISLLAGNTSYDPSATFFIQRVTATGGETSLNFSSIPSTYKHLQVRWIAKTSRAGTYGYFAVRFNSDSTAVYTRHRLYGDGSTVTATGDFGLTESEITYGASGSTANASTYGAGVLDLHDYSSTTKFKTYRSLDGYDNNGSGTVDLCSGLWRSTSAVTSVNLVMTSGSFSAGSTFALYGMVG